MNRKELVRDLARLEEMATDTNLLIHIARVREKAENGYYHLQAGTIHNPVTGSEYPIVRRTSKSRNHTVGDIKGLWRREKTGRRE